MQLQIQVQIHERYQCHLYFACVTCLAITLRVANHVSVSSKYHHHYSASLTILKSKQKVWQCRIDVGGKSAQAPLTVLCKNPTVAGLR